MQVSLRLWIAFLLTVLTACAAGTSDAARGQLEIQVSAVELLDAGVTRVSVEAAGQVQDLEITPDSTVFAGTLLLPIGPQQLIARALSADTVIGESRPITVEIRAGAVARAEIGILALREPGMAFGPIVDALTYQTIGEVGTASSFAISAVSPVGAPVTYHWTSSCADAAFSDPDAGTTTWSKPTEGTCEVTVVATSSQLSETRTFVIAVFEPASPTGAVEIAAAFIGAPIPSLRLFNCVKTPGINGSCQETIAAPTTELIAIDALAWGVNGAPGTFEISDNCGGRFGLVGVAMNQRLGHWLPPVAGGICIITARATNGGGSVGEVSAAVLVRPGEVAEVERPQIFVRTSIGCELDSDVDEVKDCPPVAAGSRLFVTSALNWFDADPGSLVVTDDCGGGEITATSTTLFGTSWLTAGSAGTTCTATIRATSLQGPDAVTRLRYQLQ